jgi:hypothetical protein
MFCILSLQFPHPTESKPIKLMRIRINGLIRVYGIDWRNNSSSSRDIDPIAESKARPHHIATTPNYTRLADMEPPKSEDEEAHSSRGDSSALIP